jgi:hypothetical protein
MDYKDQPYQVKDIDIINFLSYKPSKVEHVITDVLYMLDQPNRREAKMKGFELKEFYQTNKYTMYHLVCRGASSPLTRRLNRINTNLVVKKNENG